MTGAPTVSVCVIAYNQAAYIAQALESVLAQKVSFDVEVLIGDDASSDATPTIIADYANRSVDMDVRPFLRTQNIGAHANLLSLITQARGRYVALLEADDYWTDPQKLQRQVDYLDTHPDVAISFHNVIERIESGEDPDFLYCRDDQPEIASLDDLLASNFIPSCSALWRNGLVEKYPDWYVKLPMGDWTLHLLHAQYGSIAYMPQVMGVHRVHRRGAWTGRSAIQRLEATIEAYRALEAHFDDARRDRVRRHAARASIELAVMRLRSHQPWRAASALVDSVRRSTQPEKSARLLAEAFLDRAALSLRARRAALAEWRGTRRGKAGGSA